MKLEISKNNQLVQANLDQNSAEIIKNTAPIKEDIKTIQAEMKKNNQQVQAQLDAMMAVLQTLKPVQLAEWAATSLEVEFSTTHPTTRSLFDEEPLPAPELFGTIAPSP